MDAPRWRFRRARRPGPSYRWAGLVGLAAIPVIGASLLVGPPVPAGATTTTATTGWSAAASPLPKGVPATAAPVQTAVTCPAPGFCVAVGHFAFTAATSTKAYTVAYAAVLSGGIWKGLTVPLPLGTAATATSYLRSVSCPTRDFCVAVGAATVSHHGDIYGLTETDVDGTWSAQLTPVPDKMQSILEAVDCLGTHTCTAAGIYQNPDSQTTGEVIATESGGTWTATTVPAPSNAEPLADSQVEPYEISCSAPAHCAVAGTYKDKTGQYQPLFDVETGGPWSSVAVTGLPKGALTPYVRDLSCTDDQCALVIARTTPDTAHPTAHPAVSLATWDSGKLTVQTAPVPATPVDVDIDALSCPAAGNCVAVGDYTTASSDGMSQDLVETLAHGTWSASSAPLPTGTANTTTVALRGVDCPALGQCTAVGDELARKGGHVPLAENLTTGTWSGTVLPVPSGAKTGNASSASADAVSCTAGACGALGTFTDGAGHQSPMLLTITPSSSGYDLVGADGGVFVFPTGTTTGYYGSLPGLGVVPNAPVVGMVPTVTDRGYFLVGADGGVYAFGTAPFLGSLPGLKVVPNQPITGIVAADGDHGYFLVGKDGGVYAFGTVPFLGSLPGEHVSVDDIIGIAATPSGDGYWLISASGTVYAFGAAQHYGTATGLTSPVSAIAGTPTGGGYWVTTQNGTVKTFGDALGYGTLPAIHVTPTLPVVGIVRTAETTGYWLFGADGGIFSFTAPFEGSLPKLTVHVSDIVGAVPT